MLNDKIKKKNITKNYEKKPESTRVSMPNL
jgi:hypothetical protein